MPSASVFLDESGDLGWKFDAPYRKGGSSRYLTIAALIVPEHKNDIPSRFIKKLYKHNRWSAQEEKKWSNMQHNERSAFLEKSKILFDTHSDIQCATITVNKAKVKEHIRNDANKLYNYMIRLLLLEKIKHFDKVIFSPDPRSIKVQSGSSLPDYLQTTLWFDVDATTKIIYSPVDSAFCKAIQLVDMLSGVVHRHHEDGDSSLYFLNTHIHQRKLFF